MEGIYLENMEAKEGELILYRVRKTCEWVIGRKLLGMQGGGHGQALPKAPATYPSKV